MRFENMSAGIVTPERRRRRRVRGEIGKCEGEERVGEEGLGGEEERERDDGAAVERDDVD